MSHTLSALDWIVIAAIVGGTIAIAGAFHRSGGRTLESFFLSGRSLPWYLAGASMIATGFASDTPLWVSNLVRKHGVPGAWQYWAPLIGSMLAAVYFGRLWRRMGSVTGATILTRGVFGLYSLVAVSACMSLMFPTIYGIALQGLGDDAKFGAAGLIMAILGGSVLTPLQGALIDLGTIGPLSAVRASFAVPAFCFVVIAAYGWRVARQHC